ncbi:hypothetical protein INR49_013022 [Caranx melampygus]|nr:hypothetical protein INR49_013022 [Caranx melampygus]
MSPFAWCLLLKKPATLVFQRPPLQASPNTSGLSVHGKYPQCLGIKHRSPLHAKHAQKPQNRAGTEQGGASCSDSPPWDQAPSNRYHSSTSCDGRLISYQIPLDLPPGGARILAEDLFGMLSSIWAPANTPDHTEAPTADGDQGHAMTAKAFVQVYISSLDLVVHRNGPADRGCYLGATVEVVCRGGVHEALLQVDAGVDAPGMTSLPEASITLAPPGIISSFPTCCMMPFSM